jgi:hypothetical protein
MNARPAYRAGLQLAGLALATAASTIAAGALLFVVMVIAGGAHG